MPEFSPKKEDIRLLSEKDVRAFQALYMQEYEVELSESEARDKALRLLTLVRTVYEARGKLEK